MLCGVLTHPEAADERGAILKVASEGWTDEPRLDFLGPFANLLKEQAVTQNDLDAIKSLYGAIVKSA